MGLAFGSTRVVVLLGLELELDGVRDWVIALDKVISGTNVSHVYYLSILSPLDLLLGEVGFLLPTLSPDVSLLCTRVSLRAGQYLQLDTRLYVRGSP